MLFEVLAPPVGTTENSITIASWYKKIGEKVKKGELLFAVETDKATMDIESPATGILQEIIGQEGETATSLSVIAKILQDDTVSNPQITTNNPISNTSVELIDSQPVTQQILTNTPPINQPQQNKPVTSRKKKFISPKARKLAIELGIDINQIMTSDPNPDKPISAADVSHFSKEFTGAKKTSAKIKNEDFFKPFANSEKQIFPFKGLRRRIAENLTLSLESTAQVTLTSEVDATNFVKVRSKLNEKMQSSTGISISYNAFLVAISARALRDHPYMNCTLIDDQICLLEDINIGIAVQTNRGLITPVIHNADKCGLLNIENQLRDLYVKAKENRMHPEDLARSTFTITNLGIYGIDMFTPIINYPECAILGVGRISPMPSVVDNAIVVRDRLWLSLTFDHKIVDGAPAAMMLENIRQLIEEPNWLSQ